MNYKKAINILLRCAIYVYILSRMFNQNIEFAVSGECFAVKAFFDFAIIELSGIYLKINQKIYEIIFYKI